ncbi:MAG TPA: AadA family aminoglycoside 3''-O-nucleotidyltransferase [Cellvibrio sp.]
MPDAVPAEITVQLSQAIEIIRKHLESTLLAVHLYGSATDGGLKPCSDIDLFVTVSARINNTIRQALVTDFLTISAPPGQSEIRRALEITVVVHNEVVPWLYPPRRELQFGEWQRDEILAGVVEPAMIDADLAILLTKVRQHGIALVGASAADFFVPIPEHDLLKTMVDTLDLWNSPADWEGDEKHVVLTLARIWNSVATGQIIPKDAAASWAIERLPVKYLPLLLDARQSYLGLGTDCIAARAKEMTEFVHFLKYEINKLLNTCNN